MRKINDSELLAMIDQGKLQKDAAAHFGVSGTAVSKRLRRLRPLGEKQKVLDRLTAKERVFVAEIVSGKTQSAAAAAAFDVTTRDSAKTIGCRLAKEPDIAEAITACMEAEGLSRRYLVRKLKGHIDAPDANVSLRAVKIGLDIHDPPIKRNLNINANIDLCPVDLSRYRR